MVKSVSILLGSGFSHSANIPLVNEINDKLTSITQKDICWGMNSHVFLLGDQKDLNYYLTINEKNFFVEFIQHYCSIIGGKANFNYEVFYDFYYSMYRDIQFDKIEDFCEDFRKRYQLDDSIHDNVNLILTFNNGFNQILKSILENVKFYENNVHESNYTSYEEFVKYIGDLSKSGFTIHVHTLNHDLLFDHIGKVSDIQSFFCDGYSELGSSYFGKLRLNSPIIVKYKIRLKRFQNTFNKSIRFYKLHGSIDTYLFNLTSPYVDKTRIKTEYLIEDFYKEVYDEKLRQYKYIRGISNVYPDFLSGPTEKLRNYSDEYYDILFNHFKENLKNSDKLIIIGYGFKDSGINELLKIYLDKNINPAIVIDPNIPNNSFYKNYKFNHIQKSITSLTCSEWLSL